MKIKSFKPIVGFKNYEINEEGTVRRIPSEYRRTFKILKPQQLKTGYLRVNLYCNGKYFHKSVHRLVLETFRPTKKKFQVNHKDGNKLNNNLTNLEWVTSSQNLKHAFALGLKVMTKAEDCSWSKLTNQDILDIRKRWKENVNNMAELAQLFKLNKTTIWEIIHRKIWKHL